MADTKTNTAKTEPITDLNDLGEAIAKDAKSTTNETKSVEKTDEAVATSNEPAKITESNSSVLLNIIFSSCLLIYIMSNSRLCENYHFPSNFNR